MLLPLPSLVGAGIGGLAQGVELRFTTTVGEISLDISLCPPCHVSLGVYHTAAVYLLLCWHISTGASQNTRRRAHLAFNTSFQTSVGGRWFNMQSLKNSKPNLGGPRVGTSSQVNECAAGAMEEEVETPWNWWREASGSQAFEGREDTFE